MSSNYVLLEYYIKYLRDVRKVSEFSINHYTGAIKSISKLLIENHKVEGSVYEVKDIGDLEVIKDYLYHEPQFIDLDERGHRMYSAALNNYLKFARGEDFSEIKDKVILLDGEIPVGEKETTSSVRWKRSSIIKKQVIEMADYLCEMDREHRTFISEATMHSYMEGHHAIPMFLQERFNISLDIYANVVCLCPICHRLLHYGIKSEKQNLINKIYIQRGDRLANSGIRLSRDEFLELIS